jgi:hypothetical protein
MNADASCETRVLKRLFLALLCLLPSMLFARIRGPHCAWSSLVSGMSPEVVVSQTTRRGGSCQQAQVTRCPATVPATVDTFGLSRRCGRRRPGSCRRRLPALFPIVRGRRQQIVNREIRTHRCDIPRAPPDGTPARGLPRAESFAAVVGPRAVSPPGTPGTRTRKRSVRYEGNVWSFRKQA